MTRKKKVTIVLSLLGVAGGTALVLLFPRIKKMWQKPSLKLPSRVSRRLEGGRKVLRFDESGQVLNYES